MRGRGWGRTRTTHRLLVIAAGQVVEILSGTGNKAVRSKPVENSVEPSFGHGEITYSGLV